MKIQFATLGCKVNQYETEILKGLFFDRGYSLAENGEAADVCVVNSCTVTAEGDRKTRQMVRRFRREYPGAIVALTGCYPQAFPDEARELTEADVVTGSKNRALLPDMVERAMQIGGRVVEIAAHEEGELFERMAVSSFQDRTRAFLKIQDGCECRCSYCIIPNARGPVRSKPVEEIRAEAGKLSREGFQEVVLVGINLSMYGRDLGLRLADAVEAVCGVEGILRVRLGSLEPDEITPEDIRRLGKEKKLCPQFHMALQSGSEETLRRMGRHYTPAEFQDWVEALRQAFPDAAITTDMLVGFPGEDERAFKESLSFARTIGFSRMHVFMYSPRPGTPAADYPDQVDKSEKERRSRRMSLMADEAKRRFLKSQVGKTAEVLFESRTSSGLTVGYTPNYMTVGVADEVRIGDIRTVLIQRVQNGLCVGKLIPS